MVVELSAPVAAEVSTTPNRLQTLDGAFAALKDSHHARMSFRESRSLPSLKIPLTFSGYLEFQPPDTLIKQVQQPSPVTYLLSRQEIRMTDGITGETRSLRSESVPELSLMGASLIDLLTGNKTQLLAQWSVSIGGSTRHWVLNLTPLKPQSTGLRRVRIDGEEGQLTRMHTEDLKGTISDLQFH